jgi:uncharacterized membrane protein
MLPSVLHPLFAVSADDALRWFVTAYKVHPILVNFTAALLPISVLSDILGRALAKPTLRDTGWWTLFFAAVITPFTAVAGWFFWMKDDNGVAGMEIHKWLGTSLAVVVIGLAVWRGRFFRSDRWPSLIYLLVALAIVGALVYQGHLGGKQTFSM